MTDQNAIHEFCNRVDELIADENNSINTRSAAIRHIGRTDPDLHRRYVRATNPDVPADRIK